jgi:glycosyltransferase involved in cell wall biosynthesis
MVAKKGPLTAVRAFARLQSRVPEAEMHMLGDGPLRAAAEQLAHDLSARVEFGGVQPVERVLHELHAARVLLLPSETAPDGDAEGLPISIVEAQACGVPVVTTNHSGNPEGVMDGVTGMVCRMGDVDALGEALIRTIGDVAFLERAGPAAVAFARDRFDIANSSAALETCYDQRCGL